MSLTGVNTQISISFDAAGGQRFVVVQPTDQPSAAIALVVNGLVVSKK